MKKLNLRQDEAATTTTTASAPASTAESQPAETETTTAASEPAAESEPEPAAETTTKETTTTTATTTQPAEETKTTETSAETAETEEETEEPAAAATTTKTTTTTASTEADAEAEAAPATTTKTTTESTDAAAETEEPQAETKTTSTTSTTTKETETEAEAEPTTTKTTTSLSSTSTTPATATITSSDAQKAAQERGDKEEQKEKKIEEEVKNRLKTIHNVPRITKFGNTIETRDNVEYLRSIDPELKGFEKVYPEEHIDPEQQNYYLTSDEKCFPEDMDYLVKATNKEVYEKIYWCYAGWQEWKVANYALWDRTSSIYENVSMVRGEREVINDFIDYDNDNILRVNVIISLLQEKLKLLKEEAKTEVEEQLKKANDLKNFIQKELDKNELANERNEQFLAAYVEQILLVDVLKDELLVNQQNKINLANRISDSAYYAKTENDNRRFRVEMLMKFKKMLETINRKTHNTLVETIKNVNFNKRQSAFIDDRVATRIAHRAIYEDRINPQFEELDNYTQRI